MTAGFARLMLAIVALSALADVRTEPAAAAPCHAAPSADDARKTLEQERGPHRGPGISYQILDQSFVDADCRLHLFFSIAKGDEHLDAIEVMLVWQDDRWKLSR